MTTKSLVFLLATLCCMQIILANVLFRFAFDFHIKTEDSAEEENINKTITVENNQISIKDNNNGEIEKSLDEFVTTVGPMILAAPNDGSDVGIDMREEQEKLNEIAANKLHSTISVMSDLNREISPLVGRSDIIAAKVKIITRYLNQANAEEQLTAEEPHNKFRLLHKFVDLCEELQRAPENIESPERTLEFKLMDLAIQKHNLAALQRDIQQQVIQAEEEWQRYVKKKLLQVTI